MTDRSHVPRQQHDQERTSAGTPGMERALDPMPQPARGVLAGITTVGAIPPPNGSVFRQQTVMRLQRTNGNRHVTGILRQDSGERRTTNTSSPMQGQRGPQRTADGAGEFATAGRSAVAPIQRDGAAAAPTRDTVIPFDHSPKALPGETIIFNDDYAHANPAEYQLVFTGSGGKFDSAGGGASKTVAGLKSGNVYFHIASDWNGSDAVTVKLEVQKVADKSVVLTDTWSFKKKETLPTTITQKEAETERPLGSVYEYKLGPALGKDTKDDYIGYTVLERFGARTSNLRIEEMKPEWLKARPHLKTEADLTKHFFGSSSSNGTFTISAGDKMFDVHSGGLHDKSVFEAALITMKEIYVDLPQIYEVKPGVALGNYTIRRILKVDGTKKLRKMKT